MNIIIVAGVIATAIEVDDSWLISFGVGQVTIEDAASVCFGESVEFGLESEGIPEAVAEWELKVQLLEKPNLIGLVVEAIVAKWVPGQLIRRCSKYIDECFAN